MITAPDVSIIGDVAAGVLEKVYSNLAPAPALAHVAFGTNVAWDECCNGQVWVRVVTTSPRIDPNLARAANPNCAIVGWDVTFEVGIIRCVAVINDQGQAPSSAQITRDAQTALRDMQNLQEAIMCGVPSLRYVERAVIGTWTPLGPQGECAGGAWTVAVRVRNCIPCQD